jgi:hypothetical protein
MTARPLRKLRLAGAAANRSHTLLNEPADLTVNPSNGDIYIADGYGNHRVVVFDRQPVRLRPRVGPHPHLREEPDQLRC